MVKITGGKNPDWIPDKGNIIWVNFGPSKGHEQSGFRPGLVMSPQKFNGATGFLMIFPITTKKRRFPFHVTLKNTKTEGVIMIDQLQTIDWKNRVIRFEEFLPEDNQGEVDGKLKALLKG